MAKTTDELKAIARRIRIKTIDALYEAQSGHPGSAFSIVDLITVLYFDEMNVSGPERDRFVLSKGHAVPSLYAAFAELGWIEEAELKTLRKLGSRLQGHPDMICLSFLDAGTGALGQGASIAIGYALAARLRRSPSRTYCIIGDGESQEGQIWEAAMYAPSQKLDNLIFIIDYNRFQNEDSVESILPIMPIKEKWESFGWHVLGIDGHDFRQIQNAFKEARTTKGKPTMIIADTVKGKGVDYMENNMVWHSKAIGFKEYQEAIDRLKRE